MEITSNTHGESQNSSECFYHNPFYLQKTESVPESIDPSTVPGLAQNEEIELKQKDQIEIEGEKELELREDIESQPTEDQKDPISSPESQESSSLKDQILDKGISFSSRNQQGKSP